MSDLASVGGVGDSSGSSTSKETHLAGCSFNTLQTPALNVSFLESALDTLHVIASRAFLKSDQAKCEEVNTTLCAIQRIIYAKPGENCTCAELAKVQQWSREHELEGTAASSHSLTKNHFLYGHGDSPIALDTTKKTLDELATDFITELCFEAHRAAQVAGRQKVKLEDVKFACRKNPVYLGKIEEIFGRKEIIDKAKKLVDVNDDKITKSTMRDMTEEPLASGDDDEDNGSQAPETKNLHHKTPGNKRISGKGFKMDWAASKDLSHKSSSTTSYKPNSTG